MEYTINKLAALASISTRTLRYYDQIGLLKPCRVSSAGYRIYGDREVNLLQQIMFFRELDLQLEDIRQIITSPKFDISQALAEHHQKLISKRNQLDQHPDRRKNHRQSKRRETHVKPGKIRRIQTRPRRCK